MYLPADPDARREGYGVLSEISRMVQRVFVGSFALAAHPERSISAESVAHRPGPTVLFLNYHPDYSRSQTYAFVFRGQPYRQSLPLPSRRAAPTSFLTNLHACPSCCIWNLP